MNGFGLNAAVQAFPQAYEFGRSLVGQDNATQERLFKQQLMRDELALRQQQADQENAYKTGLLAAQARQDALAEKDTQSQIDTRTVANRIAEAESPANIAAKKASAASSNAYANYTANGLVPHVQQQTRGLQRENDDVAAEDKYHADVVKVSMNPELLYSIDPKHQARFMAEAKMVANPYAKEAADLFETAMANYEKTKDSNVFDDKLREATGRAIQPLIDQNTNAPAGTYQFDRFEPAGDGKVRVRLKKMDPTSGQPVSTAPIYVTEGRVPMAEGGVPTLLDQKDVRQLFGNFRSSADWRERNPEIAQNINDMVEAHGGVSDGAEYNKRLAARRAARVEASGDPVKVMKETSAARDSAVKKVMDRVDLLGSFSDKDQKMVVKDANGLEVEVRDVDSIQKVKALRKKIEDTLYQLTEGGTLGDYYGMTTELINHKDVRPLTDEYVRLIRTLATKDTQGVQGSAYNPPKQGQPVNHPAYGR